MADQKDADCPTCGPTRLKQHTRLPGVLRCSNCGEWLHVTPPGKD